jgi:hypothetical protein
VQAGYNAIGVLGSHFSIDHRSLVNRYFNDIVIMTDNDDPQEFLCKKCDTCRGHPPGRVLGESIAAALPNKSISWALIGPEIYPGGVKDASAMSDQDIADCVDNAMPDWQYQQEFLTYAS